MTGATTTQFVYAGADLIAELDAGNNIVRRYVPGPGIDEPLLWYEGAGVTDRRFLLPDERGSIVAVTNGSGAATAINTYDEYGVPGAGNQGRYQYTGQTFVSELGVYNYKARMYSPTLGRFMQTDPIGYGDGMNWYAYVGNDPINSIDPSGMGECFYIPGHPEWKETCTRDEPIFAFFPSYFSGGHLIGVVGGIGVGRGGNAGNSGGSGGQAGAQERACSFLPFRAYIGNPEWEQQTQRAMSQALSTPNLGLLEQNPANGSEYALYSGPLGSKVFIGGTFTDRNEVGVRPGFGGLWPLFRDPFVFHTHQSSGPRTVGHLSKDDIRWSDGMGIPIMAQTAKGKRYCHVP